MKPACVPVAVVAVVAFGTIARAQAPPAPPAPAPLPSVWEEDFARPLHWASPSRHVVQTIRRVYSLGRDETGPFLRAAHDAVRRPDYVPPPAVHYGYGFPDGGLPLTKTCRFEWSWRVLQHPAPSSDPWEDVAASIYVVMRTPGVFTSGRGFKLGWLARPGPVGTKQRGIVQVGVRHDPAGPTFQNERVDLCALYKEAYGDPEGEVIKYVGVVTDADGSKSEARADYAKFRLLR